MLLTCIATVLTGTMLGLAPGAALAQVYHQPQPRPLVTAEHEPWFQGGEAITFEGYVYYPAGPRVYFDANVMVRTGAYRGVPVYADATREPYSLVFVPLANGLMQPYERRRSGDAAGGTGTQAPSFPVDIAGERGADPAGWTRRIVAPAPPVFSQPDELVFDARMADAAAAERRAAPAMSPATTSEPSTPKPVSTAGSAPLRDVIEAGAKPKGLNEIYVIYAGYRWRSAGMAVPLRTGTFAVIGDYRGHPVYALGGEAAPGKEPRRIFLQGLPGFVAPYERAGTPVTY